MTARRRVESFAHYQDVPTHTVGEAILVVCVYARLRLAVLIEARLDSALFDLARRQDWNCGCSHDY